MRKISAKIGVTALFALGLLGFSISQASADPVECDDGDSIQAALDEAANGDTINVVGTCNERVTIDLDNLTLDGGETAVIDGTGLGATSLLLTVRASNVTIRGFTVQNSPIHGISIIRSGSAVIQGNILQKNGRHGIAVGQSSFAIIGAGDLSGNHDNPPTPGSEGNIISGNGKHGVNIRLNAGARIFHNNIINNVNSGINLADGASADIDGNDITGNTRGISLQTNASVLLSDGLLHGEANLINGNDVGVRCRTGGALRGFPQDFGTVLTGGNPGVGDHSKDTVIDASSCPVASSLAFP